MNIIYDQTKLESNSAITLGVFDGVHLGHRELLKRINIAAKEKELETTVVTFNKHPMSVLSPERSPKMLTSTKRKLELFEETTLVDNVLLLDFTIALAHLEPEDFIENVLVDQLNAKAICVGQNFSFGRERRGNVQMLQDLASKYGYEMLSIDLIEAENSLDQQPISSTLIRQYISVGDVASAQKFLGRPHEITGVVVHGDHQGRELGYPTANTEIDDAIAIPSDGVYAGTVIVDDKEYRSAISIGVRPTFHEDNVRVIEPHILDFDEDIYFKTLTIKFEQKLRDQQVFSSLESIIEQIELDCETTREIINLK